MNFIFDLDGTIGNTLPLCVEAFHKAVEPFIGRTLSHKGDPKSSFLYIGDAPGDILAGWTRRSGKTQVISA